MDGRESTQMISPSCFVYDQSKYIDNDAMLKVQCSSVVNTFIIEINEDIDATMQGRNMINVCFRK